MSEPVHGSPNKYLKVLDPGLQRLAKDLKKTISKRIHTLDHHIDTNKKYPDGKLQRAF